MTTSSKLLLTAAILSSLSLVGSAEAKDRRKASAKAKATEDKTKADADAKTDDKAKDDTRISDLAFEMRDSSGSQHLAWAFTKLTTLRVGEACWAKLLDEKANDEPLTSAMRASRRLAEYALAVTGDDWKRIEEQAGDREANRKLVEPMIDELAAKVHVTVIVEGDDCDVGFNGLWHRYWHTSLAALVKYPPASGKAFITITAAAKAKDLTVAVDKTGTKFTITAPRDIQPIDWPARIEKAFRKVAKEG